MACFLAPVVEAVVVTAMEKHAQKKEALALEQGVPEMTDTASWHGIPWSRKLGWLKNLLWGGSFLLAIEHIWHGEVVLSPPFLTAMNTPADIQPMLMEIATVGGSMVLLVTAVWFIMTCVADHLYKRQLGAVGLAE